MVEETLELNQGDPQEVVEAVVEEAASEEEQFTRESVLAMIEAAKQTTIKEASERAFRQAQSKIDQDTARIQKEMRAQFDTVQAPLLDALAKYGADPEEVQNLRDRTQATLAIEQERQELATLRQYKAQTEAERQREEYIRETCRKYKIDRYDSRLDESSPEAFNASILEIQTQRLERRTKDAQRQDKKQDLVALQEAGALDVMGGGAAMAAPVRSIGELVPFSEESVISEHLMHYYKTLKTEDLWPRIQKVQTLMKNEPRLQGQLKEAARRVHEQEMGR